MAELVIAVSFALLISGFCSLLEAVLYSVPLRTIETMVQNKKSGGMILRTMRGNVEKPITAILSLNTIANTAGAAFAGSAAANLFGQQWLGYFSALFTLGILVFSEVVPKTAGVVYARSLAPFIAVPLKWLVRFMSPFIWLCSHVTQLIARNKPQESVSPEELKTMARLSHRLGGIGRTQEKVIGNILSLDRIMVKDVMTPRTVIFSLSEHLTLEGASKKSENWEHSRFPVYDKEMEDIVGIVLMKELFIQLAKGKKDMTLTEIMRPVHFVVETATLNNVLMDFIGEKQHLFIVIDEYGGLAGLISLEDVLEEILGREIMDESDEVADKRELARQRRNRLITRAPKED